MKKITIIMIAFMATTTWAQGQTKSGYNFTPIIDVEHTNVKNQAKSGTCWSYSCNSFLESEMIRMGKEPVELSQLYSARCVYMEKALYCVRMHNTASWSEGGEEHDVVDMYSKYGAMPRELYTGLNYGTTTNNFLELQKGLKGFLDAISSNPNGKLTTAWYRAFNGILDAYLGPVPTTFIWKGKTYTPKSFADEYVGINPKDYIEIGSVTTDPYYEKDFYFSPDNWAYKSIFNVKMRDLTDIIDNALKNGYTVAWATDVSEKYFGGRTEGVAYVPEKDYDDMDDSEKKNIFDGPKTERVITPEIRQAAFDNYETTDDHGMHIVGTVKDQNGRLYYKVKNSWSEKKGIDGYVYVTKAYVQYKTTAILLHKNGVPAELKVKMKI